MLIRLSSFYLFYDLYFDFGNHKREGNNKLIRQLFQEKIERNC